MYVNSSVNSIYIIYLWLAASSQSRSEWESAKSTEMEEPRNNAVMTGNITTLRFLVDEVGVKTLNSDCKGYTPLQMAVVWGQLLACRMELWEPFAPQVRTP